MAASRRYCPIRPDAAHAVGSRLDELASTLDDYPEGELIWLEVDSIIRRKTHGQRSMNDFCHRFHGGESGTPKVVPYTFDDVVKALNDVTPYDWANCLSAPALPVPTRPWVGSRAADGSWFTTTSRTSSCGG